MCDANSFLGGCQSLERKSVAGDCGTRVNGVGFYHPDVCHEVVPVIYRVNDVSLAVGLFPFLSHVPFRDLLSHAHVVAPFVSLDRPPLAECGVDAVFLPL